MSKLLSVIVIGSIFFSACKHEEQSISETEFTYKVLSSDNDDYCNILESNIATLIDSVSGSEESLEYDKLTKAYLEYLHTIEMEIEKNSTDILFENNDGYSAKGKEFLNRTKSYSNSIRELVKDSNLLAKINFVLNTNDVKRPDNPNEAAKNNPDNHIFINKTYFKYLDYYYKGVSNSQALAYLSNRKRGILELENEFIRSASLGKG